MLLKHGADAKAKDKVSSLTLPPLPPLWCAHFCHKIDVVPARHGDALFHRMAIHHYTMPVLAVM